jgi:hypothetical protein
VPRSRMLGVIPPLLRYVFMLWCLVKYRDKFTFTFIISLAPRNTWDLFCVNSSSVHIATPTLGGTGLFFARKWLEHLEVVSENRTLNLIHKDKSKGRG